MKLWDLAEFCDLEYLSLYIADELGSEDFTGSIVVCPRGHSMVIPGVQTENLLTLKIAFGKQNQRFFLAMLHAYHNLELTTFPIFSSASESPDPDGGLRVGGVLSLLCEIFRTVESSKTSNIDFCRFIELLDAGEISELGELGVAFKTEVKKASSPYIYYSNYVMGGELLSSGQLRAAGIANAVALHWRFLLDDTQWMIQYGSTPIFGRLQRISLLLSKCYIRPDSKQYNYQSKYWPYLFAASAGWFYRLAINFRISSNTSSSTLCLTRAFELALQAQSLYSGAARLESNGEIFFNQTQLQGCGKIVDLIEQKVITSKIHSSDIANWVIRARTLLSIRNHSRLAHGIGDIDKEGQMEIMKESKNLILELLDLGLDREFSEAYSELSLPPFRERFRAGVSKLLIDYVD